MKKSYFVPEIDVKIMSVDDVLTVSLGNDEAVDGFDDSDW